MGSARFIAFFFLVVVLLLFLLAESQMSIKCTVSTVMPLYPNSLGFSLNFSVLLSRIQSFIVTSQGNIVCSEILHLD